MQAVGVRFRKAGKIYHFDPGGLTLKPGDSVVVETVRGVEYGCVVTGPSEVKVDTGALKPVIRTATPEDAKRVLSNKEKERQAFKICRDKITAHGLPMKLIGVDYTLDGSKVIFYFTSEGRIDFRQLVRDLAAVFKTRIELRQVGVRDEAKILGGVGPCGRELCCATWLSEFAPVSIRMAKGQNLVLNPNKISGVCSRLMCCLRYENLNYQDDETEFTETGEKEI
ncbi:MAG TPA: hypothetical protein EYP63_09005 [Desulfotomaculum sp.]|nr:hypothetical protein [Desulfotomaculum sp.]